MRGEKLPIVLRVAFAILIVAVYATSAYAATEKVLLRFGGEEGYNPYAGLIFDSAGNLYGTASYGGSDDCAYGCGTVFELTPKTGGGWTKKVVHYFNGKDGYGPRAGLIFDAAGNLYGTTIQGGADNYGVVFELTLRAGGGWTEKVLHSFYYEGGDGYLPTTSLIFDGVGNLYGTTSGGGANGGGFAGTVFELTPGKGGTWTEKILYSFNDDGKGGNAPAAGLIFDSAGNLYGTTFYGGSGSCSQSGQVGCGTIFELTPKGGGGWTEKILHSFLDNGKDGNYPAASLIFDGSGNLYGTTSEGGPYGSGTVFELTSETDGRWTEAVLHNFDSQGRVGSNPSASLIFDASGNLYGTTSSGNAEEPGGTVFELTPKASGGWTETVLHSFSDRQKGIFPDAGLIFDGAGNLYSTTYGGGDPDCGRFGCGTVFEIIP
jgi:uncharacterized repeat protein (TIGR03803 family)